MYASAEQVQHLINEVAELKGLIKAMAGGSIHVPGIVERNQVLEDRGVDLHEHYKALSKSARRKPRRKTK